MKKTMILLIIGLLLFSLSGIANATFIGDAVTLEHWVDLWNPSSPLDSNAVTSVATGSGDRVVLSAYEIPWTATYGVDINASSIAIDFVKDLTQFAYGGDYTTFHGLRVTDLDWLGDDGFIITGASVTMNGSEWTPDRSRLDFGSDWVSLDWHGMDVVLGTTFDISLTVSNPADILTLNASNSVPTPEPATMLLLGAGLAGLAGTRFRRKKK